MGRTTKIFLGSVFFLALLSATGCQPEGIIPEQDMTMLIADFYRADATIDILQERGSERLPYESLRIYRPILEARGYTDSVFRASLDYYLHEPKTLVKICTKARDELQRLADMKPEERFVDVEDRESPTMDEGSLPELMEGAEPAIEKLDAASDSGDRPLRKAPQRKQRKRMTRQELKQLEKELQKEEQ